jgi:hypothetical protein
MDPIDTMRRTGPSDHIASIDDGAREDHDLRQIAQRYLESGNRFNGHRSHPGNRTGKRDPTRGRRPHRCARSRRVVEAPVTAIGAQRGIPHDDRPVYRSDEADRGQGESQQHLYPPKLERTCVGLGSQGVWPLVSGT